ncbi:MAG: hypothetical protein ABSH09_02400 [Bryobacteraceae bacterium]
MPPRTPARVSGWQHGTPCLLGNPGCGAPVGYFGKAGMGAIDTSPARGLPTLAAIERDKWERESSSLSVIRQPNDHKSNPRPADGYPYRASFVADRNSALWKDGAIFVIEDDARDGVDHAEGQRSLMLVIGPHAKCGLVSRRALPGRDDLVNMDEIRR